MMDGHTVGMPVTCWLLHRHHGQDSDVLNGRHIWGFTRLANADSTEKENDEHTYVDWVDEHYDPQVRPDCIDGGDEYRIAEENEVPDRVWAMRAKLALVGAS